MITFVAALSVAFTVPLFPRQERIPVPAAEPAPERSSVRGTIVDLATGQPIAGTQIRVSRGSKGEVLWTDERGAFETETEYGLGPLRVQAWDNECRGTREGVSQISFSFDPAAAPEGGMRCALQVGRRFELDLDLPQATGPEDWSAEVRPKGLADSRRGTKVVLHGGELLWFRYPLKADETVEDLDLRLRHVDGFRVAEIRLSDLAAAQKTGWGPGKALQWSEEQRGAVNVRVASPACEESRTIGLWFRPTDPAEGSSRGPFMLQRPLGSDFEVLWLPAGTWTVESQSAFFPSRSRTLEVCPLQTTSATILLPQPIPTGALQLVIAQPNGDVPPWGHGHGDPGLIAELFAGERRPYFRSSTGLRLCGNDLPERHPWVRVSRNGRFIYELNIDDVPDAEYRVTLESEHLLDRVSDTLRPGETRTFHYTYPTPESGFGLHVETSVPSRRRPRVLVLPTHAEWDFPLRERPTEEGLLAAAIPLGRPVEWSLIAKGYKRVYGSRDHFRPSPARGPGLWANVELEPGFGIRIRSTDREGALLEGVGIEFMGRTFTTNSEGVAYLECDELEPQHKIGLRGWRVVGGDVQADGTFQMPPTITEPRGALEVILE